jgi:hypothetical protein
VLLTHIGIGTLADTFAAKTYKSDDAGRMIKTYINITAGLKEQMTKLIATGKLSEEDNQFLKNTIGVLDLVLKESEELKAFIAGDAKAAPAYDQARQKALKGIKTMLGMKD